MQDRLTISVSSINGSRHFHLSKWGRYGLKGAVCAAIIGLTATAGVMIQLAGEVDFAKNQQQQLEQKSLYLKNEVASLETDLVEREKKMQLVTDRLDDLEKLLGMDNSNEEVELRLNTAAIASSVRLMMLSQIPSGAPVVDAPISSGYGKRVHPVTGVVKYHRGQDFAVDIGTPVYAPADGVVEVTRPGNKGSGNFLRLQHAYGFSSSYSHLQRFAVRLGEFVQKGDLIGYSGNSGLSSGPHLHYEVRFVGRPLNPKPFVDWGIHNFESIFSRVKFIHWDSLVNKVESRLSSQWPLAAPMPLASNGNAG